MNNFFYNLALRAAIKENKVNEFANAIFDKMIDPPRRAVKAIPAGDMEAYYSKINAKDYDTIQNNLKTANDEVFWGENNPGNNSKDESELISERNKIFHQLNRQTVKNYSEYYKALISDTVNEHKAIDYANKNPGTVEAAEIDENDYEILRDKVNLVESARDFLGNDSEINKVLNNFDAELKSNHELLKNHEFQTSPGSDASQNADGIVENETILQKIVNRLLSYSQLPSHSMQRSNPFRREADSGIVINKNNDVEYQFGENPEQIYLKADYNSVGAQNLYVNSGNPEFSSLVELSVDKNRDILKEREEIPVDLQAKPASAVEKIVARNWDLHKRRGANVDKPAELQQVTKAKPDALFPAMRAATFNQVEAFFEEILRRVENADGELDGKEFGGVIIQDLTTGEEFFVEIENQSKETSENRVEFSLNFNDPDVIRKAIIKREIEPVKQSMEVSKGLLPPGLSSIVDAVQDEMVKTELENRRVDDVQRYQINGTVHFHPKDDDAFEYQKRPTVGFAEYYNSKRIRKGDLSGDIDIKRMGVTQDKLHKEYEDLKNDLGDNTLEFFEKASSWYFPKNFHYGEIVISVEDEEPKMFIHDDFGNVLERTFRDYKGIYNKLRNGNE